MTNYAISLLNHSHKNLINQLRLEAYQNAKGFCVKPEGILWNQSDDESIILGAWDNGELVSTMRMEIIDDLCLLEKKMECPWEFDLILKFPVMVLSKGATKPSHRGLNLGLLLIKQALYYASLWGVNYLCETSIYSAKKASFLKHTGFSIFENKLGWNSVDYFSSEPVIISVLDIRKNKTSAEKIYQQKTDAISQRYKWQGPLPKPKLVTVVK